MSRLVGGASPSIGVLTVFLLATLTFSGVLASPAAFASSSSPSFKHIDLVSGDQQNFGFFGGSVGISGGLVIVGAPWETSGGNAYAGNAYVFNSKTGALVSSLTSPDPQSGGEFGTSVAISGSLALVGAPYDTVDGQNEGGNAYVFNATTGQLVSTLVSGGVQGEAYFGFSVGLSGDVAVVGAWGEATNGQDGAGSAYILNATTGASMYTLDSPNLQYDGYFGYSVAIAGGTAIVGAWGETAGGYGQAGNAYTFNANTGALISTLTSPNAQLGGEFGSSVGVSGNLVVVGADLESTGGEILAGNAYTFNSRTGSLRNELNSNPQSSAQFGFSVGIDGNAVIVGAFDQGTGESGDGIAYTFNANTGTLTHTLANPDKSFSGEFGYSVSVSGKNFAVGAPKQIVRPHHKCGEAIIFQFGS